MTIRIDAQLSPSLAKWITDTFDLPAQAVRELGLREAKDFPIFQAAREADAIGPHQGRRLSSPSPSAWASSEGALAHLRQHVEPERATDPEFDTPGGTQAS